MRRGAAVTTAVTAVGGVVFSALMLAGVSLILAIALLLLLWLGAFVIVRTARPALGGPVVVALPLILVAATFIWLVVIFGGMSG